MTRFYSTANWQAIAKRQLSREPFCQGCETSPATLVDHITPIKQGGAMRDPQNLQSLCRSCHSQKTHAERAGRRWTPPKFMGCDERGIPRDPAHPWHRGAFDHEKACL